MASDLMNDLNAARLALARLRLGGLGEQDAIAAKCLKDLYHKHGPLPQDLWMRAADGDSLATKPVHDPDKCGGE